MLLQFLAPLMIVLLLTASTPAANTFYFTSAPDSYIGQGKTIAFDSFHYYRDLAAGPLYRNALHFVVLDEGYYLSLIGPNYSLPVTGFYPNATRYPFMDDDSGLVFTSPAGANNQLSGSFNVLEAEYNPNGSIHVLALDFVQYDEHHPAMWNRGSIRINSTIPIPEPTSGVTLLLTYAALQFRRRRCLGIRNEQRGGSRGRQGEC